MKKEKEEKPWISKASRAALTIIAAGFTLISAWNGFTFYRVLFGMSMATLTTVTYEAARMTCLFSFIRKGKSIGLLAIITYVGVASVCAFASINSFCYEVILRERESRDLYRGQVHKIKQEYSRSVAEKITDIDKEITKAERVLSSYPESATWKRRFVTDKVKRDQFVLERDRFLKEEPEDPEQWVRKNSALLGIELEAKSRENEKMISVKKALQELWGLDEGTAQKIMGIVITVTVELSILLISILAGVADNTRTVVNVVKMSKATSSIDDNLMEKFVAANREHFKKTGQLIPMRKLSRKFREVRKILDAMERKDLEKMFNK